MGVLAQGRDCNMPEPETLFRRQRLRDEHVKNLPIVLDDGLKLPNRLASAHPAQAAPADNDRPMIFEVLKCDQLLEAASGW